MSDDVIQDWKASWTRPEVDARVIQLRKRRWLAHAQLGGDLLGLAIMAGSGLLFARLAIRERDLLLALSAAALLLAGLPLTLASLRWRWRALRWEGATSQDVLATTIRRIRSSEQILKLGRGGAYCLLALVVLVWVCALSGLVRQPAGILATITATWGLAALASLWWTRWHLARAARNRAACEELLRQFERL